MESLPKRGKLQGIKYKSRKISAALALAGRRKYAERMYMEWTPTFETGVKLIDDEHRELVAILNEFHLALAKNLGDVIAFTTLNKLIRYAEKHFADEEALMAKARYPAMRTHVEEHAELMAQVFELNGRLTRREEALSMELFEFLRAWLVEHILGSDMEFGRFVMGG